LVFGLLAPIGTDLQSVKSELKNQLEDSFKYHVEEIKLSDLIAKYYPDEFEKIKAQSCKFCEKREKILHGTKLRKETQDNSVLAKIAAAEIANRRKKALSENKGVVPFSEDKKIDGK